MTDIDSPSSHFQDWTQRSQDEEFLKEDRKQSKNERKRAQQTDRSKYKKTDQKKYYKSVEDDLKAKLGEQDWLEGRVLSIMSQGILVSHENEFYSCMLKGLLKKEKTQAKNLVAVGDFVLFEKINEKEGIIAHIQPRKTFLSRADNLSRRKEQLIAVNIDQVMITVCVGHPPLKSAIIDRYIIATTKGGMKPIIVINKIDLLKSDALSETMEGERLYLQEVLAAYEVVGIPVILVSAETNEGIDLLKDAMKNCSSVFSGPSGVGKSSLINKVTDLDLRVGEVVESTRKGAHTTTTTNLIPLKFGGWCIDTPGIKSFGIWNLSEEEVQSYFPEIKELSRSCKFANCSHTHEVDCAVIDALENEKLSFLRFDSYQSLIASIKGDHVRR